MPCPLNSLCAIYHVPLQVIAPGKKLEITLSNQLGPNEGEAEEASATPPLNGFHSPNTTNLHLHGLHVSPAAPADDVETPLEPGNQRAFSYQLPDEHPSGTYWYPLLNPHFRSFPLFSSPPLCLRVERFLRLFIFLTDFLDILRFAIIYFN